MNAAARRDWSPSVPASQHVFRRVHGAVSAAVVVAALALLGGCRPLYIPLVPAGQEAPSAVRLSEGSHLEVVDGRPRLTVSFAATGAALAALDGAWMNVQWFRPSGAQAASEAVWLDEQALVEELVFELPVDVDPVAGEWRAVVSLDGMLLRQFRADVAADPEP